MVVDIFNTNMGVLRIGLHGPECQLSVGDRILELNGAPVHDRPIPDIEKLLNQRTSVVQVMTLLNLRYYFLL